MMGGMGRDPNRDEHEDVEIVEDLIMAAILEGYKKADEVYKEKMAPFGGMGGMGGLL